MKLKLLFAAILIGFAFAAKSQITVDVFINGVKSGQYIMKNDKDSAGLGYKKKDYKSVDRLSIQLSGKGFKKGYLRKVEVKNSKDEQIFIVDETLGAEGQFILTDKKVFKSLISGKPVKLYLHLTPGNTLSKEKPSVHYIGSLWRQ
jgi:hypothetical protein